MSTPLDSLSSGPSNGAPPADEERVRRILAEMNAEAVVQPHPNLPNASPQVITEPPISISTGQLRMDAGTARANVIGNSIPTMADFQAMLQQTSPGMAPYQPHRAPGAEELHIPKANKATISWKTMIANSVRGPVAVAIIVFLLNLPVVTSILSRYASWMYLSSGEISIGGLLVKALLAATLFAVYQGLTVLTLDKGA
jgi:hypothetical protein